MSSADLLKRANTGAESADARHWVLTESESTETWASGRIGENSKTREPFEDNARVMLLIYAGASK